MASLKRSQPADPLAANISSKVYFRSTRSGKVQKIVREVYLRTDIPCSSKLCRACLQGAPRNAAGQGTLPVLLLVQGASRLTGPGQSSPLSFQTSLRAPRPFPEAITSSRTPTHC